MRNSPLQSEPARSAALALTVACLLTDHLRRSRSWRDLPAFSPPLSRLFLGPATMLRAVLLALLAGLLPLASAFAVAPTGALAACRAAPADITSTPPTWDALTPHGPPPAVFFSLRASPKKLEALRLTHQATRQARNFGAMLLRAPCSRAALAQPLLLWMVALCFACWQWLTTCRRRRRARTTPSARARRARRTSSANRRSTRRSPTSRGTPSSMARRRPPAAASRRAAVCCDDARLA